jgi:predicted NAD/FAD-dependent oxidoreductase
MLPCWTVMVQPEADFEPGFAAAFVNAGPLRWIARNDSKPGRSGAPCWVLQANAEWSAAHLEQPASCGKQLVAGRIPGTVPWPARC